ncbi:hypothetical protein [Spiroplasma attinicola]|uniref:hypothetical protein n=1 Tax=Spiroplasma attinicola TaxID=2904537 RepID=UPI0020BE00FB|nr:hypothetical protein [Spiroplasma sp. JKS002669]
MILINIFIKNWRRYEKGFSTLVSFILALTSATGWLTPLLKLISGLFATITRQMINADNGKEWNDNDLGLLFEEKFPLNNI